MSLLRFRAYRSQGQAAASPGKLLAEENHPDPLCYPFSKNYGNGITVERGESCTPQCDTAASSWGQLVIMSPTSPGAAGGPKAGWQCRGRCLAQPGPMEGATGRGWSDLFLIFIPKASKSGFQVPPALCAQLTLTAAPSRCSGVEGQSLLPRKKHQEQRKRP